MNKPIMTDGGLFTASGQVWLVSDGEFPFNDCDDRTTSDSARVSIMTRWADRVRRRQQADRRRQALGLTWDQYYRAGE